MIVTADLHLGLKHKNVPMIDLGSGKISTHTCATLGRMNALVRYAVENGNNDLVILGDIFNSPYPDVITFSHFLYFLHYALNHVKVYIISGNHDCDAGYDATTAILYSVRSERLQVITECVETLGSDGYLCPHLGYGEEFPDSPPPNAILFGHGQLDGLKINGFEMESTGSAMRLTRDTASKYSRVFLGHIHKAARIKNKKMKIDVVYPGSPFPCTFGEIGDMMGFWDYNLDKFVPFKSIPISNFEVVRPSPDIFMGEVTIKVGKARINWGDSKPKESDDSMCLVKVREFTDRSAMSMERTKEVMQRFADRGLIVSSYERMVEGGSKRKVRRLASIKGEINHEDIFERFATDNYAEHEHFDVLVRTGKSMIRKANV